MLLLIPLLPFPGFLSQRLSSAQRLPKSVSGGHRLPGDARLSFAISAARASGRLVARAAAPTMARHQTLFRWIASGDLQIPLAFRLDPLSSLMILVITGIGSLIHIYSTAYMHEETRQRIRALLLLPEPLRGVHARAGARLDLPGDVRRLGRRRPLLVPADRLLVQEASRRPTPARRRSSSTASATSASSSACCCCSSPFGTLDFQEVGCRASPRARRSSRWASSRSRRCCCSSARPASRRRFRSTSGCPTRWKARRRSRR